MSPRPYRMTRRQDLVDSTRGRILDAALAVLVSGKRFSIDAVAREAKVTRVTVYDRFGTREALVESTLDHLAETGGLTLLPRAFTQADPLDALTDFVIIFCGFYSVHRAALRRLHALGVLGQGVERHTDRNTRRLRGLQVLLGRIADAGFPGGREPEAARVAHALTSFAFVDELAGFERDPVEVAPTVVALIHHAAHVDDGGSTPVLRLKS
ncbi:MAG TPA: TetR/AcrR family transcriptional regulator [Candidatus Acidoferrum sp.]|jgi:AcrR family transcriptional regulator|nr:TetR/AcrR family transcriptional regulator [Candidatus Acidoferrum sp.]